MKSLLQFVVVTAILFPASVAHQDAKIAATTPLSTEEISLLETVKSAINGAVSKGLFRAYVSYHGARYSSVRRAAQEAEEQGYAVTVHETSHLLEVAW